MPSAGLRLTKAHSTRVDSFGLVRWTVRVCTVPDSQGVTRQSS